MRTRNETYGSELGRTLSNQSVDILALELREKLLETLVVGLNANSTEDLLDVRSRGGGVAANLEEEVRSEVTHLHTKETPFVFRAVPARFAKHAKYAR